MAIVISKGISRHGKLSKVVAGSNFYSSSMTGKLSFLNNIIGVLEGSLDKDDNIVYKVWEWKSPQV